MHSKSLLAAVATLLHFSTGAEEPFKGLPRCGKDFKGTVCPAPMCCSDSGWCGLTEEYCSVPSNCQEKFGMCDSHKTPQGSPTSETKRHFNKDILGEIGSCTKPRTLALTFDDGPSSLTHEVLDVLKEYGARATFFLGGIINGRGSIDDKWASVVTRMVIEGHQVGSHTWSHPDLDKLSSAERKEQMYKNERAIANVIGKFPTFMRPPMIICNDQCKKDMKDLGYHVVS